MKGKTKAAVLMAALCVLGCSKSSDSSQSDADAAVSKVDVSGSVDADRGNWQGQGGPGFGEKPSHGIIYHTSEPTKIHRENYRTV